MRAGLFLFVIALLAIAAGVSEAADGGFAVLNPRPTGYAEEGVPATAARIAFGAAHKDIGAVRDLVAHFPRGAADTFRVARVVVNGREQEDFLVRNQGVFNGNRVVHGTEDFSVALYAGWETAKEYRVAVTGTTDAGEAVKLSVAAAAPDTREPIASAGLGMPSPKMPYHHITMRLAKESLEPGTVGDVEVDGRVVNSKFCHFVTYANVGVPDPRSAGKTEGLEGESHAGRIDGARDFSLTAPCVWTNGSKHTLRVKVKFDSGKEEVFEREVTAGGSGGYWDAAWPRYVSIVLKETVGLPRQGEPVHLTLGVFADDVTDPAAELRVVTYDPQHPKAGGDGYVVAPCQVVASTEWRDKAMLDSVEKDAETGEVVRRYDPTTTVELVFQADMLPYQEKVYQVLYGNPAAEAVALETDLAVTQGEELAQSVATEHYRFGLAANSGAVETVEVLGEGNPILLEHKLETNGAVHWNPGCYAPPTPWVHVSDWEKPEFEQITGPLMHRTRRYAPLPHMESVTANVSYTFYAGQPYVLMSSLMEVKKEIFVKALRNSELVFNHATLDEFVWLDPLGTVQSLVIEGSKEHPIHALEIPADTPWMAFISREHKVGFASITLAYENTNIYGDPPSEAQPYIYVQNGPWIYWSRPLVYPFGGQNLTRVMRARKGSLYLEENAWLPFRLKDGDDPFEDVKNLAKRLENPLVIHEWMDVDERTAEKWVMPILTMPFDEGVAGAVSGHKAKEGEQE
jgi:hypothetical protein